MGKRVATAGAFVLVAFYLNGCVSFGNTDAVREANELAISCQTDTAIALAAQTSDGTTLAGGLAELQRVVFLRDAGRNAEASQVLEARYRRLNADSETRAETERSLQESLDAL